MYQKINLQFFADEGVGIATGETTATNSGENTAPATTEAAVVNTESNNRADVPSSIPERARGIYERAMAKRASAAPKQAPTEANNQREQTIPVSANGNKPNEATEPVNLDAEYQEAIRGKFKAQHDAYMKKTIGDRFKSVESERKKTNSFLQKIASDYGVDPNSANLIDEIEKAYSVNDDKVRKYAEEHDMPESEARDILTMREQIAKQKRDDEIREQAEREIAEEQKRNEAIAKLRSNAKKTKAIYPQFDLQTEMNNEMFRKMCALLDGDTTSAYKAVHHDELVSSAVTNAAQLAKKQASQAVSSNLARPVENGLSANAPSVSEINYRNMNLKQIREFADKMRRGGK